MDAIRQESLPQVANRPVRYVTDQSISLVLPAYNEEEVIEQAIREAGEALSAITADYEIIIVDDGSRDRTAELARRAAAGNSHVRVVSQPRNMGYGAALKRGFSEATKALVGFTDADCQFDLRELDRLALLAKDYDIVSGYRIDRQDPWIRLVYSRGYNALIQLLLGTTVRDADCALKLFRREVVQSIEIETRGYLVNAEVLAKARAQGRSLVEVGVTHRPRQGGVSKVSFMDVFPVLRALARFWWSWAMFPSTEPAMARSSSGKPQPENSDWSPATCRWALFSLMLLAGVMLLGNLGFALMEPDETRYAQIAAEMYYSGDYVVPTRSGEPYLDKPPMLYWSTAASYAILGVNEYAARLPTALAGFFTVLLTYVLGRKLVGDRTAWIGAVTLLSSAGFLIAARYVLMDGLLTLFTTTALLCLLLAATQESFRWSWWLVGAIACGLGVLTKGPIALVLCLPPIVASRWLSGVKPLAWRAWGALVAIVATISVPWMVLVAQRQTEFTGYFFWKHNLVRFLSAFDHREPWWFYGPVLGAIMFPAILLVPLLVALLASRRPEMRKWRSPQLGNVLLAGLWVVGFFSISSCKLPTYILPGIPFLALALGRSVEVAILGLKMPQSVAGLATISPRWILRGAGAVSLSIALVAVILRPDAKWPLLLVSLASIGGIVALVLGQYSASFPPSRRWSLAGGMSLAVLCLMTLDFYPQIAEYRSAHHEALGICAEIDGPSLPVVYYNREASFSPFSAQGYEVHELGDADQDKLAALLHASPRVLIITNPPDRQQLERQIPASLELKPFGNRGRIFVTQLRDGNETLASRPAETNRHH